MSGMRIAQVELKTSLIAFLCILYIPGQTIASEGAKFNLPKRLQHNVRKYFVGSSVKIAAIRVEFPEDQEEGTTGNGRFDLSDTDTLQFDPPPHNKRYFKAHINALSNYYANISHGSVTIDTGSSKLFPEGEEDSYQLANPMRYYSPKIDEATDDNRLALLFFESVTAAAPDVDYNAYDCVAIFHAGVGKDFTFQLDLTPFDIPSAYLDSDFLRDNLSAEEYSQLRSLGVERGLILAETQTQEGFNIALNGTFALLFGSFLGIPSLWDTDTGNPGIGKWGLMDQGSNNMDGAVPARPSAFTRMFMGWENPVSIRSGSGLQLFAFSDLITDSMYFSYKIPISSNEYFLIENRRKKRTAADNEGFEQIIVGQDTAYVEFDPAGSGVIVSVVEYDAGIPGSGLLIWHINERVVNEKYSTNRINTDINNRGVSLEEGDGSEDIGHEFGFLEPGGGSEVGTPWDAFYARNPAWYFQNPDWTPDADSTVAFTGETNPDSRSNRGGATGISVTKISMPGSVMRFDLSSDFLAEGFPLYLGSAAGSISPAVADLDGDGEKEILIGMPDGTIHGWTVHADMPPSVYMGGEDYEYLISVRGDTLSRERVGVFAEVSDSIAASLTVGDLYGDGVLEVVALTVEGRVILYEPTEGETVDNRADSVWSVQLDDRFTTTPAIFNGQVFIGGSNSGISVLNSTGGLVQTINPGEKINSISITDAGFVNGSIDRIVSGYLYREGVKIISLSTEGMLTVSNTGLLDSPGEPALYEYQLGESVLSYPALADIDADGELELVITGNNKLWAFNGNLTLVENFPVTVNAQNPVGFIESSPVVGDVDGDGFPDIVFGASDGLVYGFHVDGTPVDGFPLSTGGSVSSTPVIDDIIPGGAMEVVVASDDGYLYMWSVGGELSTEPVLPWQTFGGNNERTNYAPLSMLTPPAAGTELMEKAKVFAYPNPAEGNETRIRYFVNDVSRVDIMIFDMAGEYLTTLVNSSIIRNEYNESIWDVRTVSSGIYLARVSAIGDDGSSASKVIKIAVVK